MKTGLALTISTLALGLMASCGHVIGASVATYSTIAALRGVGSLGSQIFNAVDARSAKSAAQRNNENMNALKIGQTKEEVFSIMGKADRRDTFETKDGQIIDINLYRTEAGVASSNEFEQFSIMLSIGGEESPKKSTPLLILKEDKLAGWGMLLL